VNNRDGRERERERVEATRQRDHRVDRDACVDAREHERACDRAQTERTEQEPVAARAESEAL
jgi:hypothetical protein